MQVVKATKEALYICKIKLDKYGEMEIEKRELKNIKNCRLYIIVAIVWLTKYNSGGCFKEGSILDKFNEYDKLV